ncbi:MAG: DUF11 domain-containing protein, partial [Planctomycetota bacterium]
LWDGLPRPFQDDAAVDVDFDPNDFGDCETYDWSCDPNFDFCGMVVHCWGGSLAPGRSTQVTIVPEKVPSWMSHGEILTNTALVEVFNADDPIPDNDTAVENTTVIRSADLQVTKSDTPDPVVAGEELTYTIQVTNNGPSDATGVTLTDDLPGGVTFVSSIPGFPTCTEAGGEFTCGPVDLAPGPSDPVTIVVAVHASTPDGTILSNSASVTANEHDPDQDNNSDTEDTLVTTQEADLEVTKTDSPDPVEVEKALTYTIQVTNNGPGDATDVTLTDVLPADVTFASVTPGAPTCTQAGGQVTCNLGGLTNGSHTTVTLVVTPTMEGVITNTVSVTGTQPDLVPDNNRADEATRVEPLTVIQLSAFSAEAGDDSVRVWWETMAEIDTEGFNLWRSQVADGSYVKLNTGLIPARGNADTGASYEFTDGDVVNGVTYYYKLEDVDLHGISTFHGPVSVTLGSPSPALD